MPSGRSPLSRIETNIAHKNDENTEEEKPTKHLLQRSKSALRHGLITSKSFGATQPTVPKLKQNLSFSTQPKRVLPTISLIKRANSMQTLSQTSKKHKPLVNRTQQRASTRSPQGSIFQEIDTPISKLPNDCLLTIFRYLSCFEDYCTMMSVCQRWRRLASQPHIWRDTQFEYTQFYNRLAMLPKLQRSFKQLHFIRRLTITNKEAPNVMIAFNRRQIEIRPFQRVEELCLINISLVDIKCLVTWLKDTLKVVTCRKIRTHQSRQTYKPLQSFDLNIFSELYQLQHLFVEFAEPVVLSSIYVSLFPLSISNSERKLPASLKAFSMINVLDYEQQLIGPTDRDFIHSVPFPLNEEQQRKINMMLDRWIASENHLVSKYQAFSYLSNLTSLTLDCVSSFTAKVWRTCYIPIAGKLTYLSMKRWPGQGERDSPTTILSKRRLAEPFVETNITPVRTTTPITLDTNIDDVEMALSDFITSLLCIEEMRLDLFMCDTGLINGIQRLKKRYKLEHENVKADKQHIKAYKGSFLNKFKITFVT
ncbi:hypothetical protein BDF20DRAFT_873964 [Mycotypha africana]|uniref:uncharacterized protein n=1 Tax=Mycotypha africana TaxID=64632 RepID=UPI0023006D02|nr:uncharacterized protein BDF20DRAFT_873964 [Mycotypha africana]KAI8977278.1 hypothetical protein BDF20DRAFT_873964 [Mycotypha africana]